MPVQFFLTADPAPYVPGVWKGSWDSTADAVTKRLDSTKTTADPAMYTIQSVSATEIAALLSPIPYRVALGRFVGGKLAAQNISGTVQMVFGLEASLDAELYGACHIWVSLGDSDSVRLTLVDNYFEPLETGNAFPATPEGHQFQMSVALNAGDILDDDRVIIEYGFAAFNATTAPMTGVLYYGTDFYSASGTPDMQVP